VSSQPDHAREALEQVCARGNLQRARELYAEDFVDHVNAVDFHGHDGIARSVALYRAIFPDLAIRVLDQAADGDRVTSRWTLHGTHKVRAVTLPGITISRFENGKIAEDWTVSDNLELLRQLGPLRGLALAGRYLTGRLPGSR
jgi:predicted ester cyclase